MVPQKKVPFEMVISLQHTLKCYNFATPQEFKQYQLNNIIAMKEQLSIVRECYEQLPTLPGFYKNWTDLANAVNHALLAQSMDPIDEVSLSKLVQDSFKVKIENEYKRGDEIFPAIRIYLPKPIPPAT